jgi:uncharacterized protein DUF3105
MTDMTRPDKPRAKKAPRGGAAARGSRPSGWTIAAITVVALFAVAIAGYALTRPATTPPSGPDHTSAQPPTGVQTFTGLSRQHVTGPVTYPQTPPVGGAHNPAWLNCGTYTSPVPNENAVHSLEHGAVWITYQPDLPADQLSALQTAAAGQHYVMLSPYPGLPTPVVATAWGVQLRLNNASDPRLAQFIHFYQQGPQTPEPGAPCSAGTGTPSR